MYDLTVIIPTFNEEANIRNIVLAVDAVFRENSLNGQVLVVDDNSSDGTISAVTDLKRTHPNVDILVRTEDHGLSQSVADGFRHAASEVFVVIDADFSHPPVLIPRMYEEIKKGCDVVIGSRYMEGGGIKDWPLKRRIISTGATFLGRLLFPDVTDPVSGFFAVKKSVVTDAPLKPRGYKILLEVLGKGSWEKDKEIPFEFIDREAGASKLKIKTIIEYAEQVIEIALHSLIDHQSAGWREWERIFKFGIVGLSGIVVNQGLLIIFKEFAGWPIWIAGAVAIQVAIVNNFLWNDLWTFKATSTDYKFPSRLHRLFAFEIISSGGAVINYAVLNLMVLFLATNYQIANIIGILLGFVWNFLVNRNITWKKAHSKK